MSTYKGVLFQEVRLQIEEWAVPRDNTNHSKALLAPKLEDLISSLALSLQCLAWITRTRSYYLNAM